MTCFQEFPTVPYFDFDFVGILMVLSLICGEEGEEVEYCEV